MFHLRILLTALRGLRQNLLRSMLATLGVIIGVGAVVSAVSILEGAQKDILERFESLGADQVLVFNGTGGRHRAQVVNSLEPEDAVAIEEDHPQLVAATAPQFRGVGQVKYFEKNAYATILGATATYGKVNNYSVSTGRFLTREDVRGQGMVCVLGYAVANELFGAMPAVGKTVKINGKSFIVVGVMEEAGALGFTNADEQALIPLSTAMYRMFGQRYLTLLVVQCRNAGQLMACIDGVKQSLRKAHRIKPGDTEDFTIYTQEQIKQQFGDTAKIFAIVLYSIAGISIVVGAIGIMNIMLVSVTERTREIGVRIAVGARRFDILKQFLAEASTISLLGGALGFVCGWAITDFLSAFTEGLIKSYTPMSIVYLAITIAIVVGVASGIYPAIRAARLDPVQALRYE